MEGVAAEVDGGDGDDGEVGAAPIGSRGELPLLPLSLPPLPPLPLAGCCCCLLEEGNRLARAIRSAALPRAAQEPSRDRIARLGE